jgi:hypothetical protein
VHSACPCKVKTMCDSSVTSPNILQLKTEVNSPDSTTTQSCQENGAQVIFAETFDRSASICIGNLSVNPNKFNRLLVKSPADEIKYLGPTGEDNAAQNININDTNRMGDNSAFYLFTGSSLDIFILLRSASRFRSKAFTFEDGLDGNAQLVVDGLVLPRHQNPDTLSEQTG